MDSDIKSLLEENLKLARENNKLLLKVRSVQRWSQISRVFYWIIIVAIGFGALYFIQPYIGSLLNIYTGGVTDINTIKNIGQNLDLDKLQNAVKGITQ